jgi:PAS domain S-box-containing protein
MSTDGRASILLVDDRDENLVALQALLDPLGHNLVTARSGDEALKHLLARDFALILLDVQMPELDGFQTATLIKQRARSRHIPIIFLTAISKDAEHVFRGYTAGAVDYLVKPFDPEMLRAKVSVFVELWEKTEQLRRQTELLRRQELAEAHRESEERYRRLADAMPAIVWIANRAGEAVYYNARWFDYTGIEPGSATGSDWQRVLHPDDLGPTLERWSDASATEADFEIEYRFLHADGGYRWHLARAVPVRDQAGHVTTWVGAATEIEDQKQAQAAQRFLVQAGELLGSSLDYRRTLADVAHAAVPEIADWCAVHVVEPDGSLRPLALAHVDPKKVHFVEELQQRYPQDPQAEQGIPKVIRSGEPDLVPEISDAMLESAAVDDLHLALLRELDLRSYMCVPLVTRGRVFGAVAFVQAESGRVYGERDLGLAQELARRASTAIENSQLYGEAERRAQAARVLATVGDGVFLVDDSGVIRFWNPAAEAITGLPQQDVVGRPARAVLPGWDKVAPRVPVASEPGPMSAESVPVEAGGREVWLSMAGVRSADGTVYAFRDLTEERAVEELKTEFVATVSHELRTPLAAIYGSAMTLKRDDLDLEEDTRRHLLDVVADESDRLARIVNDLLLASHLASGRLQPNIESCDAHRLARKVIETAQTHLPDNVTLELQAPDEVPPVKADPAQLRQVLANLVDNAVRYSPEGGPVQLELRPGNGALRFVVRDRGLGIAPTEQRRIFEKFYRVDPQMTRGVGGTGLGLYICRELVRQLDGRIWVESQPGKGSTFFVEVPAAQN